LLQSQTQYLKEGPCLRDCATSLMAVDEATGAVYWQRVEPSAQMIVATNQSYEKALEASQSSIVRYLLIVRQTLVLQRHLR
jgi:hypothetical protein